MPALTLQRALARAGFDPGPLDGLWGVRSRRALQRFQRVRGLAADGIPGPRSLAALGLDPSADEPIWMRIARGLLGTRERPGAPSNPAILAWAEDLGNATAQDYRDDAVPWCGLFAAHCIATGLPDEPLPANPLWARSWARFGIAVARPVHGAIGVFKRPGGGGHVGFLAGEDPRQGALRVLGGNQSDAVGYAWIASSRLLALRWPATCPPPSGNLARMGLAGALSMNEG